MDSWTPCPVCSEEAEQDSSSGEAITGKKSASKAKRDIDVNIAIIAALPFLFFAIIVVLGPVLSNISFFNILWVLWVFLFLLILNSTLNWQKSDDNIPGLEEMVGDATDANRWVRNRFLLMNVVAIAAASLGFDSITMNHIIFWGALILGGLIWAIPSKPKRETVDTVDVMFDDRGPSE